MGAPRASGGFKIHADDHNALAEYVDQITPVSGQNTKVSDSASGYGRTIDASPPGASATSTLEPFQILAASDDSHPGRVRIVNGYINSILPDNMAVPDSALPDGTDNRCYLTVSSGLNYVYVRVLVDTTSGLPDSANVYRVDSPEEPDGSYVYLLLGTVNLDSNNALAISQATTGSKSLLVYTSADGETLGGTFS